MKLIVDCNSEGCSKDHGKVGDLQWSDFDAIYPKSVANLANAAVETTLSKLASSFGVVVRLHIFQAECIHRSQKPPEERWVENMVKLTF